MGDTPGVLPKLTLNRLFVSDLMAANAPCFAMGYVEVEEQQSVSGFLALRPDEPIPVHPPPPTGASISDTACWPRDSVAATKCHLYTTY